MRKEVGHLLRVKDDVYGMGGAFSSKGSPGKNGGRQGGSAKSMFVSEMRILRAGVSMRNVEMGNPMT